MVKKKGGKKKKVNPMGRQPMSIIDYQKRPAKVDEYAYQIPGGEERTEHRRESRERDESPGGSKPYYWNNVYSFQ